MVAVVFVLLFLFIVPACALSADTISKYKLQPSDILNITVHGHPDLTTKTRVTSDGSISFPLVGKVKVEGLTVQELESSLKASLEEKYLVSAPVLIFIEEYHPRQVSLVGEVAKPGKYDMPQEKDMTLLEAIAMAGGFTKDALTQKVKIMRTEDSKEKVITVNAKEITLKGKKEKDIILKPDDVIVVPESFF
ncbi:MAG: polysaccharide biosynthesis/export family protein [Candidatus Omnitrophota bacterium]